MTATKTRPTNRFPCSVCGAPGGYIVTTRGGTRQWELAGSPTRGRKHYCKTHVEAQIATLNARDAR